MEINYYYDIDNYYTYEFPANNGSLPPFTAVRVKPELYQDKWPKWNHMLKVWEQVENHTVKCVVHGTKVPTAYWLPEDTWETEPRYMTEFGALPDNAVLTKPEKPYDVLIQELQNEYSSAIQNRLNTFAQTRLYDNINSACTYANSTNPKFKIEGEYCIRLRDETWATAYTILETVLNNHTQPTIEEVLEQLPVLQWPN